jgi:hypothetical protein
LREHNGEVVGDVAWPAIIDRASCCRKDENPVCPARVRIVAEPLEAYVEG